MLPAIAKGCAPLVHRMLWLLATIVHPEKC